MNGKQQNIIVDYKFRVFLNKLGLRSASLQGWYSSNPAGRMELITNLIEMKVITPTNARQLLYI